MTDSESPILSYMPAGSKPTAGGFVFGCVLLALTFLVTFWIVEVATSNVLLFHLQIEGPADPGTIEEMRLEKRQFGDLVTEFVWSIPATCLMVAGLFSFGPRQGLRLRGRNFLTAIAGAVLYSWIRWGLYMVHLRVSDGVDFWLAMLLAVFAGWMTSLVRSRQSVPALDRPII